MASSQSLSLASPVQNSATERDDIQLSASGRLSIRCHFWRTTIENITCGLILCVVISGCAQSSTKTLAFSRQASKDSQLELVYEGDIFDGSIFPTSIFLRDAVGVETLFKPRDAASIHQSSFVIERSWSPNHDWLQLPDGRFDGFVAFRANDLPKALRAPSKGLRVGVSGATGTRWWHEFTRWKSSSVFEFSAGLSGDLAQFECNLITGQIVLTSEPVIAFARLSK